MASGQQRIRFLLGSSTALLLVTPSLQLVPRASSFAPLLREVQLASVLQPLATSSDECLLVFKLTKLLSLDEY